MADLVVHDLHVRLGGAEILKGISLAVRPGQIAALLGPSGSGKTTLLRAVAGLETPHAGSIRIGDKVLFDAANRTDLPAEKRNLGLVFQSYALWPHRNVFDNVAYGLTLRGIDSRDIETRVAKTLNQIGLGDLGARFPHQLSGGQQQRVAIARALVYEPPVILLDEPLSNLDAKLREEARAWLRNLIVTLGLSAICVTHDQIEAMAIADHITLLNEGNVEQAGTPTQLYAEPSSLFSAEFMGINNRLNGTLIENSGGRAIIEVAGERLSGLSRTKAAPGSAAIAVSRLERAQVADAPGSNRIEMELRAPTYLGERWELVFGRETLTARSYAAIPHPKGRYFIEFPADALWIF
jgi:iron(III) transport system ATP-binding protein